VFRIILFLFFTPYILFTQNVKILDEKNNPIAGVSMYTTTEFYVTSDIDGNISLDNFSDSDSITIQQYGFNNKKIIKSSIPKILKLSYDNEILNEVIVSASKFSQLSREIPKKINQLNQSTIKFTNPMTSADLLERSGNVYIQKSQLGGGSPMIRGLSTNRLVITVDSQTE